MVAQRSTSTTRIPCSIDYLLSLEIHKQNVKFYEKNLQLELYDTSEYFHSKTLCKTYYKICSSYIMMIDLRIAVSVEFFYSMHRVIANENKNSSFCVVWIDIFGSQGSAESSGQFKSLVDFCENEKIPFLVLKQIEDISMSNSKIFHMIGYFLLHHIKSKKIPFKNPHISNIENDRDPQIGENQSKFRRKWSYI